jgi:hypothetical protein
MVIKRDERTRQSWEFSNRHEAGRMLMTAINPDFSAVMFYVL